MSTETVNVVISLLSTLTLFPKWDLIQGEQTISTYHGIEKQDFERNRHESLNEISRKRCLKTPGSRGRLHSESDGAHWMCLWVQWTETGQSSHWQSSSRPAWWPLRLILEPDSTQPFHGPAPPHCDSAKPTRPCNHNANVVIFIKANVIIFSPSSQWWWKEIAHSVDHDLKWTRIWKSGHKEAIALNSTDWGRHFALWIKYNKIVTSKCRMGLSYAKQIFNFPISGGGLWVDLPASATAVALPHF